MAAALGVAAQAAIAQPPPDSPVYALVVWSASGDDGMALTAGPVRYDSCIRTTLPKLKSMDGELPPTAQIMASACAPKEELAIRLSAPFRCTAIRSMHPKGSQDLTVWQYSCTLVRF